MMRRGISVLGGVVALMLAGASADAQLPPPPPCDSLTGGGFITTTSGSRANFAVGGSCKKGGDGHGLWGHLEYIDHGFVTDDHTGLNVHWTEITAYVNNGTVGGPNDPKRTGSRIICGKARTNLPPPNETVDWAVTATDNGEPGTNNGMSPDIFSITVTGLESPYSQFGTLQGGNIQLHKPNNSTTSGSFSDLNSTNCPALCGTAGCID